MRSLNTPSPKFRQQNCKRQTDNVWERINWRVEPLFCCVWSKLHWHYDTVQEVRQHCPSNLRRGASGESLGATPLATDAKNSCLFCCTRHAARMILWHGVRRYGRFTFCAKSSVTISKSVCGDERESRRHDLNKSGRLKVRADDLKFCFVLKTGLWCHTKSHNELLLSLLCRISFYKSPDLSRQLGVQWRRRSFILPLSRGHNTKKKSGKYIPCPRRHSWIMQQENLTKSLDVKSEQIVELWR